jgi:hypothetical protein
VQEEREGAAERQHLSYHALFPQPMVLCHASVSQSLNPRGVCVAKAFWLGIIGGIFGILGAVLAILIQSISNAFSATSGSSLYYNAAGAIIFSIVGIAGGVLETRKILGAALMIIQR